MDGGENEELNDLHDKEETQVVAGGLGVVVEDQAETGLELRLGDGQTRDEHGVVFAD